MSLRSFVSWATAQRQSAEGAEGSVLHLLSSVDETLLCRRDALLLLDALLYPGDLFIKSRLASASSFIPRRIPQYRSFPATRLCIRTSIPSILAFMGSLIHV